MAQVNDSFQLSFVNTSSDSVPISLFQLGSNDPNAPQYINQVDSVSLLTTFGNPNTAPAIVDTLGFRTNEIDADAKFLVNGVFQLVYDTTPVTTIDAVFNVGQTKKDLQDFINQELATFNADTSTGNAQVSLGNINLQTIGGVPFYVLPFNYSIASNFTPTITNGDIPATINITSGVSATRTFALSGGQASVSRNKFSLLNPNVTISGTDDYLEILNAQNGNEYNVYYIYGLAPQGGADVISIDRLDSNGNSVQNSYTPVIDPYSFQNVYQINPEGENALDLNGRAKLDLTLAPNSRTQFDFYYRNVATTDAINNIQPLETDEGFERDNTKQKDFVPKMVLEVDYEDKTEEQKEEVDSVLGKIFGIKSKSATEKEKKAKEYFNIIVPLLVGYVAIKMSE
tara:strand:+ start:2345 stop:3541 length:1197 start_codon:yes stop_codon:yes gene_type:complete